MRIRALAGAATVLTLGLVLTAGVAAKGKPPAPPGQTDKPTKHAAPDPKVSEPQPPPVTDSADSPAAAATTATTTTFVVFGAARCLQGKSVVGIYVNSSTGGGQFASWKPNPSDATLAYYQKTLTLATPTTISLHVGCGGSASTWASDNWSPGKSVSSIGNTNWLALNAVDCQPSSWASGKTVRGSCGFPAKGLTRDTNWFDKGYCTCGAAALFKKNLGAYPGWPGSASAWADNAKAVSPAWRVSSSPWPHSLIVFPGSRNHVGWVTKIDWSALTLTYIDMNGGHYVSGLKTDMFAKYDKKTCSLKDGTCSSEYFGTSWTSLKGTEQYILVPGGFEWTFNRPSPGECAV